MVRRQRAAISNRSLIICSAVIFVITLIGITMQLTGPQKEEGTLTISRDDQVVRVFTVEEIMDMPSVEVEATIVSSDYGKETGTFTGVPMADVLNMADEAILKECKQFITKAEDGYAAMLTIKDVESKDDVLIIYKKDGKFLGSRDEKGTGPLRILIPQDPYGNRSAKYLNEITVK